ncbi:MAG: hypothetical protein ACREQM_09670 [Candidatus Dormibacteraceae bacterium]
MTTTTSVTWPPPGWTEEDVEQLTLARDHLQAANSILDELGPKISAQAARKNEEAGFGCVQDAGSLDDLIQAIDDALYAKGDQTVADYRFLIDRLGVTVASAVDDLATRGHDTSRRIQALVTYYYAKQAESAEEVTA